MADSPAKRILSGGKVITAGYHKTAAGAAMKYDARARALGFEESALNFPDGKPRPGKAGDPLLLLALADAADGGAGAAGAAGGGGAPPAKRPRTDVPVAPQLPKPIEEHLLARVKSKNASFQAAKLAKEAAAGVGLLSAAQAEVTVEAEEELVVGASPEGSVGAGDD